MKTIIYIISILLVSLTNMYGQSEPPTPPATPTTSKHSKKNKSSTSINIDGNTYSYFSTTDSDEDFKIKAKFDEGKNPKIKSYLIEELGRENLVNSGSKYVWKHTYDGDTAYEIRLDKGSLRMYVDKELASSGIERKMKTIGKNIKNYTSGSDEKRDKERLKREADRKLREADRLKREADRLKREAERLERDAKRKSGNR